MCICINCKWVDRCITYNDVENNHGVDHICDLPDFKAKKPLIHVNIVKDNKIEGGIIAIGDNWVRKEVEEKLARSTII